MKQLIILSFILLLNITEKNNIVINDNTVFIFFDSHGKFQKKESENNKKPMKRAFYYFDLLERNPYSLQNETIKLNYNEYANFDELERLNPVPVFKVNKSFLRKNKKNILNIKKMQKMGYPKVLKKLLGAKNIFLIEKDNNDKKKVIIKKVIISHFGEE